MPILSKKLIDIEATLKWWFTLKCVRGMITTYSQMHRTDKYSQQIPIIWPVWLNGWVSLHEISGCGFESSSSHLNFRFHECFEKGVSWHSNNHRVWIHSETPMWRVITYAQIAVQIKIDKTAQSFGKFG